MKPEKVWPVGGGWETLRKFYFTLLSYRERLKSFSLRYEEGLERLETQRTGGWLFKPTWGLNYLGEQKHEGLVTGGGR